MNVWALPITLLSSFEEMAIEDVMGSKSSYTMQQFKSPRTCKLWHEMPGANNSHQQFQLLSCLVQPGQPLLFQPQYKAHMWCPYCLPGIQISSTTYSFLMVEIVQTLLFALSSSVIRCKVCPVFVISSYPASSYRILHTPHNCKGSVTAL